MYDFSISTGRFEEVVEDGKTLKSDEKWDDEVDVDVELGFITRYYVRNRGEKKSSF